MSTNSIMRVLVVMSLAPGIMAGQSGSTSEVTLFLENSHVMPAAMLALAQGAATRIFAGAGVRLRWRSGNPTRRQDAIEIGVNFISGVPDDVSPWAFARSFPLETKRLRIDVLVDRFQPMLRTRPLIAGPLLGHTLAHEIAHVMQGVNRHSENGILRARWDERDYQQMRAALLEFNPVEVRLIQSGMESRLRNDATRALAAR
jgi:hypothetical protein